MPVRLVLGRTREPEVRTVAAESVLELSRRTTEPFWIQEIPGLYGLEPYARVVASLKLTGELPSPLPTLDAMDWDWIAEASDADIPLVIHHPAATLIPPGWSEPTEEEPGSLLDLKEETESVLQAMTGPSTLTLALRDVGVKPFGLEWFAGRALLQACEMGLEMGLPLTYQWRYPLKDPRVRLTYHDASFWGLDELTDVWLVDDGREIRVRLSGGYVYRLPVEYAQTWFFNIRPTAGALATGYRIDPARRSFEIDLDDRQLLDISVVSLLAGCEPMYEHFGGWTPEAEENVRRGFEKYGPFRIEPADA